MTVIEKAVQWAIATANDNSHGYSQASRWGNPDYDCSSFVITAYEQAGVPVRRAGASYTGNMRAAFVACGFVDVTYAVGIASGYGIEAGDVLLNYAAHTCLAIGGGKVANCRTDEGHPQAGDQSGNEIRIQNYWDGSPNRWNCVLRYKGSPASSSEPTGSSVNSNLRKGAKGEAVKALQRKLISLGYSCGKCGADGDFGNDTMKAVAEFQEDHNLTATGEVDAKTQEALNSAKKPEEEPDKEPAEKPAADKEEHAWIPPDLSMSSREEDGCVVLQALLNAHGWDCGKADGIFGAKTQAAVNQAKEFYGMKTDGKCTEELWIKLGIDPAVFERR